MFIYLQMIDSPEDQSKFELVYRKYGGLMYHVAYEILQNKFDSEDAVHQAFIKIAENIHKIEEPVCPKTKSFVVIIVRNKALDIWRASARHRAIPLDEVFVGTQAEDNDYSDLGRCLAQLPTRYRDILLLKYRHGYTNKEVARILGITEANAIKVDQRAKAKLKQLCKEEGLL